MAMKFSLCGGVLSTLLLLTSCSGPPATETGTQQTTQGDNAMTDVTDLAGRNIPQLAAAMAAGEFSAEALTRHFLDEIASRNDDLRAVIAVNPEAIDAAVELDRERVSGSVRSVLHGIPVLIKDNIESLEQPTTAGSLALADNITGRDAPVIRRLREAGAVILGKANLSEWANFRSTRSSSGWSAVGGQARNPHDPSRSPCGSSAGSGVAVAAGFAVAAVGTETNGSVICPSSINGLVGIKPTVGLLSRTHIVPISSTQDTAGPMTANVTDAAILLAVMQGPDSADAVTSSTPDVDAEHYLAGAPTLAGKRLGVLRDTVGHPRVQALLDDRLEKLEQAGATLVPDIAFSPYDAYREDTYNILLYEFRLTIRDYLASLDGERSAWSLDDLINFNEAHAPVEMPWFGQEIFIQSRDLEMTEQEYEAALDRVRKATREEGIDRVMKAHRLDAIIAPSNGPSWQIDLVNGDRGVGGFTGYPAVAGYPHITVPMGTVHGLPIGLSLTAGAGAEAELIALALAFEAAVPPLAVPTQ